MDKMTKEEFEKHYFRDWTENQLNIVKKEYELEALPCNCDYEDCKGWFMNSKRKDDN